MTGVKYNIQTFLDNILRLCYTHEVTLTLAQARPVSSKDTGRLFFLCFN